MLLGTMLPVLGLLGLLAWASLGSGGRVGVGVNQEFGKVAIEPTVAAPFTLELMNGQVLELASLEDKVVLVDFWASGARPAARKRRP